MLQFKGINILQISICALVLVMLLDILRRDHKLKKINKQIKETEARLSKMGYTQKDFDLIEKKAKETAENK